LESILKVLPYTAITPNLLISVLSRTSGFSINEVPVISIPRRGGDPRGSTWRARRESLPSRRFVKFCILAGVQWITSPLRRSGVSGVDSSDS